MRSHAILTAIAAEVATTIVSALLCSSRHLYPLTHRDGQKTLEIRRDGGPAREIRWVQTRLLLHLQNQLTYVIG